MAKETDPNVLAAQQSSADFIAAHPNVPIVNVPPVDEEKSDKAPCLHAHLTRVANDNIPLRYRCSECKDILAVTFHQPEIKVVPATPACQKTWTDGDKAYGCVLPQGHAGDHHPYAHAESGRCRSTTVLNGRTIQCESPAGHGDIHRCEYEQGSSWAWGEAQLCGSEFAPGKVCGLRHGHYGPHVRLAEQPHVFDSKNVHAESCWCRAKEE